MPAKTEAKETAAPEKEKPAPAVAAAPAAKAGLGAWIPAIAVAIIAPAASWGVTQFVLMPTLQKKLLQGSPAAEIVSGDASKNAGKNGPSAPPTYGFDNVVVNLAGTMGTRYLKTSFIVTGSDPSMHAVFEENKVKLTDVTLNVLSSLSLADLEEPGSKNVLREKLVGSYNQALGRKMAEQVYFSDFVVQ